MLRQIRIRTLQNRVARPSALRSYVTPTRPSRSPMAQLAEEPEPEPITSHAPLGAESMIPPGGQRRLIQLPTMIHPELWTEGMTIEHQKAYPSGSVIDTISMISICLRREEHVPRAFQMFRQMLADAKRGERLPPDAELFGRMAEALTILGRGDHPFSSRWRERALDTVTRWHDQNGAPWGSRPVLVNDGIRVYRGLFAGLVGADASLDRLLPFLASGEISAQDLMLGIKQDDWELALDKLQQAAKENVMPRLVAEVEDLRQKSELEREILAHDTVPELKAVQEIAKPGSDPEADQTRFQILGLRRALSNIGTANLPLARQKALEEASYEVAREELVRSAKAMEERGEQRAAILQRNQLQAWMHRWVEDLTVKIRDELELMRERVETSRSLTMKDEEDVGTSDINKTLNTGLMEEALYLYLTVVPTEKLALITVLSLMRGLGSSGIADGIKAVRAMLAVGKAAETEYHAETLKNVSGSNSPLWTRLLAETRTPRGPDMIEDAWNKIGLKMEDDTAVHEAWNKYWTPSWTQKTNIEIGSWLLTMCVKTAKVERTGVSDKTGQVVKQDQAAFIHTYEYVRGKKLGLIKINPIVAAKLSSDFISSIVHPKNLPMLVQPLPWKGFSEGGYLRHKTDIMRTKNSMEQKAHIKEAISKDLAEPLLHALDVLSQTRWRINRKVFDTMIEAWNSGDAIADIPNSAEKANYVYPEKPKDVTQRIPFLYEFKRVTTQQRKDHAERCKQNYTLEIARAFVHDVFFLPHNMDFRGRCYPIPPYLSPTGDDMNRGLLMFADKKPLGKTGLRWLQIHLANVYGYDKMSFEERARFTQAHEAEIFESADNPLGGSRWWLKAEDPWQCLATCVEVTNALRSPNPEEYQCGLPVHQDGTCNGMQHYAALGGDVQGAKAVNLENGDRPSDVYSRVVDIVNKMIEADKKEGVALAQLIKEPLGRKIVKQTVMTTVYGVTFVGARDQIAKQLEARGDLNSSNIFSVSAYVAKTVLSCIGDLFSGAKDIQEWLTTSARLLSRSIPHNVLSEIDREVKEEKVEGSGRTRKVKAPKESMTAVIWTTHFGLPIVQPYRKANKVQYMTSLQSVYVTDPNKPSEVSATKQASAFPPNFIHSLDATHMYLTALSCAKQGMAFAAVHDSYWTHPSTVERMSESIRDCFIQLHSRDLIGQLREEFIERNGDNYIPLEQARAIHVASDSRAKKETARRARVKASLENANTVASMSEASTSEANLVAAEIEVFGEDISGAIDSETEPADDIDFKIDEKTAMSMSEYTAHLQERGGEVYTFAGTKYVKIRDVLPATPPKGEFQIEKIRDSAYFFS